MTRGSRHGWATARYTLVWLLASAVVALVVALAVRSESGLPSEDPIELETAAREAECVLRRETGAAEDSTVDVMQPPTFGPPSQMAAPGVYTRSPSPDQLVGALRRGLIVVQYRPRLAPAQVEVLRRAFADLRETTVITPDATGMRYAVAVTAWTRLLGCSRIAPDVARVARAFHGEYADTGPDASR